MIRFFLVLSLHLSLFAADFDSVFVGSSPFSLIEALCQAKLGKNVLVLEAADRCGGAWQSIDVCNVTNVDLGCHMIGKDLEVKKFLEEYIGCDIVSLDNPSEPFQPEKNNLGWYFSKGCFELIDKLLHLIKQQGVTVFTNCKAIRATCDETNNCVAVDTEKGTFITRKLFLTPMSDLAIAPFSNCEKTSKFYHLYLLVQDPTPPRFTYEQPNIAGVSRVMNLTHFVDLMSASQQLIVIQTYEEKDLSEKQFLLSELIDQKLLDASAYILQSDQHIYETGNLLQHHIQNQDLIEVLQTGHFYGCTKYMDNWKQALTKK